MSPRATKATLTRAPARKARRDWRPAFLKGFEERGTVTGGCEQARIARSTAYQERERDGGFAARWSDVEERVTDKLEATALTLALAGETRLIEFLLKARRPDTYRDQHRVELTGSDGGPITTELIAGREASDAAHDFIERISGSD